MYLLSLLLLAYGIWTLSQTIQQVRHIIMVRSLEKCIYLFCAELIDHLHSFLMKFHLDRKTGAITNALEGIINPKDIKIAVEHNINAVIISNHGGRQLDTVLSSIEALKLVRDTVNEKMEIILDGGVRNGVNILKALALGAKAVILGRPILWGVATGGEEGVKQGLNILKSELDIAIVLCGYPSVTGINAYHPT